MRTGARHHRAHPASRFCLYRQILFGRGQRGSARGLEHELKSRGILFGKEAKGKNPKGSIVVTECASVGFCAIGAAVMVYPDGVWYAQVRAADVPEIIEQHLLNGRIVERLALLKVPAEGLTEQSSTNADWEA